MAKQKFEEVGEIPSGKALVYIYRPKKWFGFAISYNVKANGEKIFRLKNGSYYPFICDPGATVFSARTFIFPYKTAIDIEEGIAYYLRGTIHVGLVVGRPRLKLMRKEEGEREIRECSLVE